MRRYRHQVAGRREELASCSRICTSSTFTATSRPGRPVDGRRRPTDLRAGYPRRREGPVPEQQAEKYRWPGGWPGTSRSRRPRPRPPEEQADRWLAELDRYGIDRVGFATGGGNDTLAGVVARHPDRFIGFAHHNLFAPERRRRA